MCKLEAAARKQPVRRSKSWQREFPHPQPSLKISGPHRTDHFHLHATATSTTDKVSIIEYTNAIYELTQHRWVSRSPPPAPSSASFRTVGSPKCELAARDGHTIARIMRITALTPVVPNSVTLSLARVSSHRKALADRCNSHPEALPHANLCTQRCRRQVALLVLPRQAQEGQESEW